MNLLDSHDVKKKLKLNCVLVTATDFAAPRGLDAIPIFEIIPLSLFFIILLQKINTFYPFYPLLLKTANSVEY